MLAKPAREFVAGHLRHAHVGQEQIERAKKLRDLDGFSSAGSLRVR